MYLVNLEQGSADWLEWRMGGIGGSDAPIIMGVSPYQKREDLLSKKIVRRFGAVRKTNNGKTDAMLRGLEKEPMVRDTYNRRTGRDLQPQCGIHDKLKWMRASFDGLLIPDYSLVLEIKCPNKNDHSSAIEGLVPTHYWPQMQHLLAVSGGQKLHYLSWSENRFFGERHFAKVVVLPDPAYQAELIEAEKMFVDDMKKGRAKLKNPKRMT